MSASSNAKQLIAKLQARQRSLQTNSPRLNEAFLRIGLRIQAKARINATKQGVVDTGKLRSSIDYKFFREGSISGVRIGVFGIPYAAINEFGGPVTRAMIRAMWANNTGRPRSGPKGAPVIRIAQGAETGTWRPRPYLIPAFKQEKTFILETIAKVLGYK